jgi:hypothetical protein
MSMRLKQSAVVVALSIVILILAAQLIRPDRSNPPIDPRLTLASHAGVEPRLVSVLDRSCSACHSNATEWPSYAEVAPLSWLMAYGVKEGRAAVNFSEWGAYSPAQQHQLLAQSCRAASSGSMPGVYASLEPETRLTPEEIELICAAARRPESAPADSSQ